jgi:hypothetical protein
MRAELRKNYFNSKSTCFFAGQPRQNGRSDEIFPRLTEEDTTGVFRNGNRAARFNRRFRFAARPALLSQIVFAKIVILTNYWLILNTVLLSGSFKGQTGKRRALGW